jgi:hypothetical protein
LPSLNDNVCAELTGGEIVIAFAVLRSMAIARFVVSMGMSAV